MDARSAEVVGRMRNAVKSDEYECVYADRRKKRDSPTWTEVIATDDDGDDE